MNYFYDETVTLRRRVSNKIGMCADAAIYNTSEHSVYPILEFYEEKGTPDNLKHFEQALDNLIRFLAPDIEVGDCLAYGTNEIEWVMVALEFIPPMLIKFPRRPIPGTRMELVLLPESEDQDYLQQCLDKTE